MDLKNPTILLLIKDLNLPIRPKAMAILSGSSSPPSLPPRMNYTFLQQTCCISTFTFFLTAHVWEAAEQQGQEKIENDQVSDEDSGQKVRHTGWSRHINTIPHGLNPFSTKHSKHDHKAVHEVCKVPPRHVTGPLVTHFVKVVFAEELHAHHGENEDDNTQDECEVGQRTDGVGHDCQNVIERFPRLC